MSSVMKKEVNTRCKSVRANLFTVVCLIDWPSIDIVKPKSSLEAYLYISYASLILTSTSPVIPPSLPISLFYRSMLKTNSRIFQSIGWWWSTIDIEVVNSPDFWIKRSRTKKMNNTVSRNYFSVINLIKENNVLCWSPSITLKGFLIKQEQVVTITLWYHAMFNIDFS